MDFLEGEGMDREAGKGIAESEREDKTGGEVPIQNNPHFVHC